MDYVPRFAEGAAQIARYIGEGRMRIDEDIVDGIENAYSAFMGLFSGGNRGKRNDELAGIGPNLQFDSRHANDRAGDGELDRIVEAGS